MDTTYHQAATYRGNVIMTALNIYISNLIKQGMYLVQLVLWGSLAVSAVLYVVSIFGDLFWISDMLHNFALHLLDCF